MATEHSVTLGINTSQVKQASVDLADIQKSLDAAGKAVDRFGDKSDDAGKSVESAGGKTRKVITGYERMEKAIRDAERVMQQMAQATAHMGSSIDRMEAEIRQATAAMRASAEATRAMQASLTQMGASVDRTTASLGRVGAGVAGIDALSLAFRGLAGVITTVSVAHFVSGFMDAAQQIDKMSRLVNTAPETFQRWSAAARVVGVEQDKLADIMKDLQDKAGDFIATGGGEMQDFFTKIAPQVGITADQFRNLAGPDALQLYVNSLERAGVSQSEMTFYMEAMANDATLLLPILRNNGEELERLGKRADELGAIMDTGTIEAMRRVRESTTGVQLAFEGLRNTIMVEVAPSIESFADTLIDWSKQGGPINESVSALARNLDLLVAGAAGLVALSLAPWFLRAADSALVAAANARVYDVATRQLNVTATAATASLRGLNAVMGAFGGPWGLAITAVATGLTYWALHTDEATAALNRHDSVVNRVKQLYKEVGGDVERFAEKVKEISLAEAQHEWVLAVQSIKKAWADLDSLRPMDGLWDDAPMLKFMEAFDKLHQNNDFGAFRNVMNDVVRLDPAMADTAARAQEFARKLEEAQKQGVVLHGVVNELRGSSTNLAGVLPSVAGGIDGVAASAGAAIGQVGGLSNAMRELIGYVPEMAQALKAQDALTKARVAYQTEVQKLADQFVKDQNTGAYMAGYEKISGVLEKATDSITGFTKANEHADKLLRDANRNALPERARRLEEIRDRYADYRKEAERGIELGQTEAQVRDTLAKYAAAEAREIENANRKIKESAEKHGKAKKAVDQHAKNVQQLDNAVDQLIHRNDEQIKLLELEAAGYGKSAEEVLYLKYAHDAETAAMRTKVPLTEQHLARLREQAQQVSALTAALDAQRKAQEAVNEVQDLVSATWVRALEDMILNAQTLQDAIKGIGDAWSKASLDALLTGKGPLAQFTGLASNDPSNPNAIGGILGALMGNQTQILGQLPKQVQKGAETGTAMGGYEGTKAGTIEGTAASGVTSWLQQNGKTIMGVGAGLTSLVGAYGVGAAGGSMGMAGLGGAVSGVTGGLSLATGLGLSSAMMGPLAGVGAAIGAGLAIYSNQQAKKQAKQERWDQAQSAYQEAIPQIESFTRALRGEITGSLQQTIDEVHQKANELGKVAFFAYQFDEVKRIENEFNAYVERTREEFRDGYAGMLDQLSSGGGMSGAFSSAKSEMQSFGDELLSWVEDVKEAFQEWGGPVSQEATSAAQRAALAMLEPVETLSAVQSAIQQVNGRASALQGILEDLYMSSDDAARAINEGVLRAMDALRTSFSEDLTSRLNDVSGRGYINEMADAFAEMRQLYTDADALGLQHENGRIWDYFRMSAQEIVDGAELTGSAFAELTAMFPELVGSVHEYVAALDGAVQAAWQFNDSMHLKVLGATGRQYISTAMDLIAERDALRKTAEQVGGDMELVDRYFSAAAQSIVDSSQLTGGAFSELLLWVPELTGHVSEFAAAVQSVGKTTGEFYEDMIDKVLGAQGKGYISDMRGLLKERDELTATAQQLGVDVGLVSQYFDLSAQNIVDSAQLTGEAFNDLLAWFPQLAGQLTEFSQAAQEVGNTFWDVQNNIIDKIVNAQGKGYIVDMRDLIREREELTALAQSAGVDLGLVNQYFSLASQGIVDSANLTGDAFADLLAWFPDLSGSLREAGQAVEQTAAQIAAAAQRLQGYEDRWFSATNDNGSLDGALREFDRNAASDRAAELAAGGQHLVALERALAAERLGVMAQFASQAVSAAQSAVDAARQNLERAAQAAIDAAQAQVDAAQQAAQAAAQAVSDAQSRVDAAQTALERAQDAVRQGYEDQAAALRDTVSRLQSFVKGIQQFKASLALDDSLSPFSPAQQLAEAQRQYQEIAAKALAGDTDAMDQLESVSRNYLSEARDYYASSEAYYQAFNDVQSILDQVSASAQGQLSEAERQLAALDAQIAALTRIDDTVLSIEQAQAELLAAQQDLVTAQQQQAQADSALSVAQANLEAVQSQMDALLGINTSVMSVEQAVRELGIAQDALAKAQQAQADILAQQQALAAKNPNEIFVQQAYRDVFGREADSGGLAYWTNQMDVGASSAAEVLERLRWEQAHGAMRLGGIVGSYATGGMVGNGMWDVDSVLARYAGGGNIALAGGEFVTRAPAVNRDTLPTLAAINATGRAPVANDDSAKDEIRALRQEVASLKQALVAGFNATVASTSQTTSAVRSTENTISRQRIGRN